MLDAVYKTFFTRLKVALGYAADDPIEDSSKELSVLCNHAAVRIERLTKENEQLKTTLKVLNERQGVL